MFRRLDCCNGEPGAAFEIQRSEADGLFTRAFACCKHPGMVDKRKGLPGMLKHQAAGGLCLMLAAALAIALNNSRFAWLDDLILATDVGVHVGAVTFNQSLLHWINDGLMAIFFFMVGLEIKRELLLGALSTRERAILPAIGALVWPRNCLVKTLSENCVLSVRLKVRGITTKIDPW